MLSSLFCYNFIYEDASVCVDLVSGMSHCIQIYSYFYWLALEYILLRWCMIHEKYRVIIPCCRVYSLLILLINTLHGLFLQFCCKCLFLFRLSINNLQFGHFQSSFNILSRFFLVILKFTNYKINTQKDCLKKNQ